MLRKLLLSTKLLSRCSFASSRELDQILQGIKIESNNQHSNILESGIISSKHIDSSGKVTIALNLTKDYRMVKGILKDNLEKAGFNHVDIVLAPKDQKDKDKSLRKGNLTKINKIIAVSSCKGGVGKSTIAINFAAQLKQMGHKVGIFDSDIYGPSLPTLINKEGVLVEACEDNAKEIQPIMYEDLSCMSFGFVGSKPAVMRGPIISSIVSQLLHQTRWGQLDYLIVDMPPGTGDIQISLCQELRFDGAVIVTTPQRLSYIDVIKGIEMFQQLRVRIVGVVENMAYYQCGKCGNMDAIFGRGYTKMIQQQFGIENTVRFPLVAEISKYSDLGTPLTLVLPNEHKLVQTYSTLCHNVIAELSKHKQVRPTTYYNTELRAVIIQVPNLKKKINPYTLRLLCKCAGCVHELTGAMILKKEQIDPEVYPVRIEQKGNYAVAMVWSDGHRSSIYSYKRLLSEEIPAI